MLKRLLTASVLLAVVLTCIFWLRQYSLVFADVVILLFALVGTYEMYASLKKAGNKPIGIGILISAIIIYPLVYFLQSTGLLITLAVGSIVSIGAFIFQEKNLEIKDLTATIFTIVYPLIIMSMMIKMNHSQAGLLSMFLVFAIVVFTDTMAYFVGVTIKGKKLCPSISPKKTISGAIGGLFGGIIGAILTFMLFEFFGVMTMMENVFAYPISTELWGSALFYILIGIVGAIIAELGDLGASVIKRKIGIKDYGHIFPGHGGVMDRIDSFLFVIPLVYFMFEILYIL